VYILLEVVTLGEPLPPFRKDSLLCRGDPPQSSDLYMYMCQIIQLRHYQPQNEYLQFNHVNQVFFPKSSIFLSFEEQLGILLVVHTQAYDAEIPTKYKRGSISIRRVAPKGRNMPYASTRGCSLILIIFILIRFMRCCSRPCCCHR